MSDAIGPRLSTSRSLVERVRTTGLDATLTIEGQRRDVPAAVDRTVYRIVQESLTNIARHAAAATASVRDRLPARHPRHPGRRRRQGHDRTAPRCPASGCSGCANGSPPSAVACARNRAARAASPSRPNSRGPNVMIRVLLVDDQPLIRSGFRALLDIEDDIEVVAEAADGRRAGPGPAAPARHRAHRHPDAGHGRHRGDPAHRRGPGPGRGARRHPDQLRATPDSRRLRGLGCLDLGESRSRWIAARAAVSISGLSALRRDAELAPDRYARN